MSGTDAIKKVRWIISEIRVAIGKYTFPTFAFQYIRETSDLPSEWISTITHPSIQQILIYHSCTNIQPREI